MRKFLQDNKGGTIVPADLAKNSGAAIVNQTPDASRALSMINLVSKAAMKVFHDIKVEGDGMIS